MTIEDALQNFTRALQTRGLAPRTIDAFNGDARAFATWHLAALGCPADLVGTDPAHVSLFRRALLDQGQRPATINRRLAGLRRFFAWVVDQGLRPNNPVAGVRSVPTQAPPPRALSRVEALRLLRAARQTRRAERTRNVALLVLLLHTGLRASEVCNLQIGGLNLGERSGWVTVRRGKGEKWREVPLNVTVRRALQEYLAGRAEAAPGDALFYGCRGQALTPRGLEHLIAGLASRAGLEGVMPHTLRHTFCRGLVDEGVPLDRVALLAGRSRLDTTARYTRPTAADLEQAVEKLLGIDV